jgi:hypothetical protein
VASVCTSVVRSVESDELGRRDAYGEDEAFRSSNWARTWAGVIE